MGRGGKPAARAEGRAAVVFRNAVGGYYGEAQKNRRNDDDLPWDQVAKAYQEGKGNPSEDKPAELTPEQWAILNAMIGENLVDRIESGEVGEEHGARERSRRHQPQLIKEIDAFAELVLRLLQDKKLTEDQVRELYEIQRGQQLGREKEVLLRQGFEAMKKKLLEFCPEAADDLHNLGGQNRT
jgi:hypothetical protein